MSALDEAQVIVENNYLPSSQFFFSDRNCEATSPNNFTNNELPESRGNAFEIPRFEKAKRQI